MKLYHMAGACSLADLIVLNWLDVPHDVVPMTPDSVKAPDYLAINAIGSVPLLMHDGWALTENVAILGYLADLHPHAALAGDGSARGRAEVMRWLAFLNSDVHKAFKPLFSPARFLDERDFDEELARNARHHIRHYLERIDAQLAGRDWLTGQRSVADPYLFVVCAGPLASKWRWQAWTTWRHSRRGCTPTRACSGPWPPTPHSPPGARHLRYARTLLSYRLDPCA